MPVLRFQIYGLVQGVGFRDFARRSARDLGLTGYVRNLSDGSVEAVARGDDSLLRTFAERLRRGPAPARVDRIETGPAGDDDLQDEGFVIRW